jgi:hypothetical protein
MTRGKIFCLKVSFLKRYTYIKDDWLKRKIIPIERIIFFLKRAKNNHQGRKIKELPEEIYYIDGQTENREEQAPE